MVLSPGPLTAAQVPIIGSDRMQAGSFPPVGMLAMWATSALPAGWLLCNGAVVSRTTYAALFAVLGTLYGAGDGSTTFGLPDLRGRFVLGVAASGTGSTLAGVGGAIDHGHTVDPPATQSSTFAGTVSSISLLGAGVAAAANPTVNVDVPAFNSGVANPPFLALHFAIRAT